MKQPRKPKVPRPAEPFKLEDLDNLLPPVIRHFKKQQAAAQEAARLLDPRDLANPPHMHGRWTPNL